MGTRSRIAIANSDGSFTSIYCHWDGYPEGVGATLLKHYTTYAKVRELMALGDLSSLGDEIGEKHDFESRGYHDWCKAYGRDRGETGIEAETSPHLEALFLLTQQCGGEYVYVFSNGSWKVGEGGVGWFGMPASAAPSKLVDLATVLADKKEH